MSTPVSLPTAWRLPASLPDDLAAFDKAVAQFKQGAVSATQFQVFRVPQGVYEQRESGTYMLRVRFPAGVALPHQLRKLADVAERHGNGILHVTTRQDVQVHRVPLEGIHPALVALAEAGLSTKGGGGNTVRNITGCPHAGVCADEVFDVTPHVLALTEFMLSDPQSFQLPRKYKIAFSCCGQDCSAATVNDLGFIAKARDDVDGFSVYVGGGMGSSSRVADLLEEFVPAAEVPLVAEAVKRVFNTHGNRKDKRLARLRFLIKQLGLETFRKLYREQLEQLRQQPPALPVLRPVLQPVSASAGNSAAAPNSGSPGFQRWRAANLKPQKQAGFHNVEIPLFLGDIPADKLRDLAGVVEQHGEQGFRTTQTQNFILRWVREDELEPLHEKLSTLGLAESYPPMLREMIACAGASTCKLGICLSRGLAKGIANALSASSLDPDAFGPLQINISGCPNACGRHPVADIGLHGAARRVDGRLVPHYVPQFGGHVEEGKTQLAAGRHAIPAHSVPAFLVELLSAFEHSGQKPDFQAFLRDSGAGVIEQLAAKYKPVPSFAEDKNFYFDWGAEETFSLAGRGPGECGAGVFDLIDVDLKSAAEALQEKQYFRAAALASRALLVTRGEQAGTDKDAFDLFQRHFIEAGLVDSHFQPLVALGTRAAAAPNPAAVFGVLPAEVATFVGAVQNLFKSMDATLQFPKRGEPSQPSCPVALPPSAVPEASACTSANLQKDFRGVTCPLNYVKTKMALAQLKAGQTLSVLLDGNGARNVPDSAAKDGHEILSIMPEGTDTRVVIRKKS
ncbi:MAG: sulfurtransferase TusA family protein [Limisphaerales bacterium]